MNIDDLLTQAVNMGASDLHLISGSPPAFRIDGDIVPSAGGAVEADELETLARGILNPEQQRLLDERGQVDLAYEGRAGRFRINVFRQRGTHSVAVRVLHTRVPSIRVMGFPAAVERLALLPSGLVLVTGPTGCGKSTTLAAMIDLINEKRRCHIVTLEDPIEYVHRPKGSIIAQREIGTDSASFAEALRAALRQDPDVILVGEMRDLETISTALTAAETGHLVLATLHTPSAAESVDRIIDVFEPHQQQQVRIQLASVLGGVISQRLLPRIGGGRVAALEILIGTPAVSNLIREGKTHQILSVMQTGGRYGMVTMEAALRALVESGQVLPEHAAERKSGL